MTIHQIEPDKAPDDRLSPEERTAAIELLASYGGEQALMATLLADIIARQDATNAFLVTVVEFCGAAETALAKFAAFKMPPGLGAFFGGGK